jgi:hypothetical protein
VTGMLVFVALFGMAALLVFVASDALVYVVKTSIRKMRATYRRMGRTRFLAATALLMMWGGVYVYLCQKTGWPDAYGAHWVGRGAAILALWQSPALLKTGTVASDTLFVWLWLLFPAILAFSFWRVPRKLSRKLNRTGQKT